MHLGIKETKGMDKKSPPYKTRCADQPLEIGSSVNSFANFSASNSRKLIPLSFLKMANSRKLTRRKINSTIYLPKNFRNGTKSKQITKNDFIDFPKFRNSRKLIPRKINSTIYLPKKFRNGTKSKQITKKALLIFQNFEICEDYFRKFFQK